MSSSPAPSDRDAHVAASPSLRLAYADPPYPGRAHLYPENAEVDHRALVATLVSYDGWALSTDSLSLHFVLSLCPASVQVAAWIRPNAMPWNPDRKGAVRSWEPVIYAPARRLVDDPSRVRDVLTLAAPNGHQSREIPGCKPRGFGQWVFGLLGAIPGDNFIDLFPGSGGVGEEWSEWDRQQPLFAGALGGSGSFSKQRSVARRAPQLWSER